jgi:radical SAM superfamily enzyme YgiQ (UPF0313 family)
MKSNTIILTTLSPKTHRTSEENLGIEYLKSSLVEQGYEVQIIDGWLNELSVDKVFDQINNVPNPLFVGISSYMSNTMPTVELMQKLKQSNASINLVCGGFGPTFYPEEYLKNGADIVIRGEGEEIICNIANALKLNKPINDVKGISYINDSKEIVNNVSAPLIKNLDIIPFPSRDTMEAVLDRKSTVNMLTARGCSGNCAFCSVISFFRLSEGKVWRTRSINNIVDELKDLYNNGIEHIKVVDDSFIDGIRDEKWAKDFADEIERRGIEVKLRGQIRADKITDSILYHLKRAGFYSFACGIENGSESALRRMNKTASLKDNENALELFKKYNYLVQMGYILFDRYTTLQELEENYEFLKKYDFAVTKGIFSEMYSAEGTKLNAELRNSGELIESNFINNNNKYSLVNEDANAVYNCLKSWHKSHSEIYDMTIDPLSSPKTITDEERQEFYNIAMILKKQDLLFFRKTLDMIKLAKKHDLTQMLNQSICETREFYEKEYEEVKTLYKRSNLIYNADKNPFI